jgi:hypothetical protein
MILEGFEVEDKKDFVEKLNSLMMKAYACDSKPQATASESKDTK